MKKNKEITIIGVIILLGYFVFYLKPNYFPAISKKDFIFNKNDYLLLKDKVIDGDINGYIFEKGKLEYSLNGDKFNRKNCINNDKNCFFGENKSIIELMKKNNLEVIDNYQNERISFYKNCFRCNIYYVWERENNCSSGGIEKFLYYLDDNWCMYESDLIR